jgi:hypothetical protein
MMDEKPLVWVRRVRKVQRERRRGGGETKGYEGEERRRKKELRRGENFELLNPTRCWAVASGVNRC